MTSRRSKGVNLRTVPLPHYMVDSRGTDPSNGDTWHALDVPLNRIRYLAVSWNGGPYEISRAFDTSISAEVRLPDYGEGELTVQTLDEAVTTLQQLAEASGMFARSAQDGKRPHDTWWD